MTIGVTIVFTTSNGTLIRAAPSIISRSVDGEASKQAEQTTMKLMMSKKRKLYETESASVLYLLLPQFALPSLNRNKMDATNVVKRFTMIPIANHCIVSPLQKISARIERAEILGEETRQNRAVFGGQEVLWQ